MIKSQPKISFDAMAIVENLNKNKIKSRKGRKIEYLEFIFDAEKRIHSKRQPQMKYIGKQKQFISREKTSQWLKDRSDYQEVRNEEYDPQFEEKRKAFSKQLEVDWEE
ncbi:plasmid replication initiation protein [Staphylococcus hominis]